MNKNILTYLKDLGLNEKQAEIYLALVEIGRGTAYAIAKHAKVKRPNTYVILEELRKKGLVLKIPHDKNQVFVAKDPNELFVEQEEKIRIARKILPELLARASRKTNKAVTYLFEGLDGLEKALKYKQETPELLTFYAKSDKGVGSIPKIYIDHDTFLANKKIKIRGFAPAHQSLSPFRKNDSLPERNIKELPSSEFSPNVSVEIGDTFIKIFLHKEKQVLIVENKDFSELLRQVFEIAWKAKN
jgi:DNA-binding MarR family transcriptional regulator